MMCARAGKTQLGRVVEQQAAPGDKNTLDVSAAAQQQLTSSLKSSLNGSMSLNCRSLGSPPTLWWLLMVWLCFWPLPGGGQLSITSGYRVPCKKWSWG
jgi:hypothetical protein